MPTYNQDLSATSGNAPTKQVGLVDPLTGAATQQMTNVPPQQANTLGNAQPVFNLGVQQAAQGIHGGVDQRQKSVGAPPLFQKKIALTSVQEHVQQGFIKEHKPIKEITKPVYQPSDRPRMIKTEEPGKYEKIVEKQRLPEKVINQRL